MSRFVKMKGEAIFTEPGEELALNRDQVVGIGRFFQEKPSEHYEGTPWVIRVIDQEGKIDFRYKSKEERDAVWDQFFEE